MLDAEGSTVLGPAVADAAGWFEQQDWIGMIATPYCGQYISAVMATSGIERPYCIEYEVPLKGRTLPLWTIPRPDAFAEPIKALNRYFTKFDMPVGTESKYINTLKFAEWCSRTKEDGMNRNYALPKWREVRVDHS